MRKITFGVLVIALGVMAALPFRRYQSIPDASTLPDEATGPTQSSLSGTHLEMLVNEEPHVVENLRSLALTPRPTQSMPNDRSRSLAIPTEYSQIAVPLHQIAANEDDFNATTAVRKKAERKRLETPQDSAARPPSIAVRTPDVAKEAVAVKPPISKQLASKKNQKAKRSSKEPKKSFGSAFARLENQSRSAKNSKARNRQAKSETNATLASTSNADAEIERLPPAKQDDGRKRNWIRQP